MSGYLDMGLVMGCMGCLGVTDPEVLPQWNSGVT